MEFSSQKSRNSGKGRGSGHRRRRRKNTGYLLLAVSAALIATTVIVSLMIGASWDKKASATTAVETENAVTSSDTSSTAGTVETKPAPEPVPNAADIEMLAKVIYGEARGVKTTKEKAAVVWCVLNRVDDSHFPDTVADVVTQRKQFAGYDPDYPATPEHMKIAEDVLVRWLKEKSGEPDVGRVLPKQYTFFTGDGVRNYFVSEWRGNDYWDWSFPSPYGD